MTRKTFFAAIATAIAFTAPAGADAFELQLAVGEMQNAEQVRSQQQAVQPKAVKTRK